MYLIWRPIPREIGDERPLLLVFAMVKVSLSTPRMSVTPELWSYKNIDPMDPVLF